MAVLRHANVVRLKAICVRPPCLITEYAPNHSLADLLAAGAQKQADKVAVLTWKTRVRMVRGAVGRPSGCRHPQGSLRHLCHP